MPPAATAPTPAEPAEAPPASAPATEQQAIVLPTVTPLVACDGCPPLHRPDAETEREIATWARQLDGILAEAVQDLGLTLDVSKRATSDEPTDDAMLIEQATDRWVFSPRIAPSGRSLMVRLVAIAPGHNVLMVRTEEVPPAELEVRAMAMTRDLVRAGEGRSPAAAQGSAPPPDERAIVYAARSRGRAVLALNSAALGGYIGFALQRTGGSDDPRLTYPLIALGTGIGLGASMIVADEWDVGVGDAWYLSAATWWPTLSGLLLAAGYDQPSDDRYLFGLVGAASGLSLGTFALTFGGMSEGGAVLAHSGGAFGTLLGGLGELIIAGNTDETPTLGLGYGAGIGVLVAGATARFLPAPSPSRLLMIDLVAGLGGLTGAAVASPLVFDDPESEGRNRAWLSSIAAGIFVGAAVGAYLTAPSKEPDKAGARSSWAALPYGGIIATDTVDVPVLGGGLHGWW